MMEHHYGAPGGSNSRGFTLIEVMIVVVIVALLLSFAVPSYQNYVTRTQVAEGLSLSASVKIAVSEFYVTEGVWPGNNAEANVPDKHDIIGDFTEHISVKDNIIEIKYGYGAGPAIFNEKILLTATANGSNMAWACASAGKIQSRHLPATCR